MGLFLLLISIFSVVAQNITEEETVLVPIEEVKAEQEPTLYEDEPAPELIDDEVKKIPKEVDDAVGSLPDEGEDNETPEEGVIVDIPEPNSIILLFSMLSRGVSLVKAGINKARGIVGWIITRDYVSVAKNIAKFILRLSIWLKLLLIFFGFIFLLVLWSYFFRDTRTNNLRRARKLHRRGECAHNKGREEKADECYAKAAEYREKAQDQW